MSFPEEICLARSPNALHRTIDGKAVILHAETGTYFSLNALGSRIWGLLENGATLSALCSALLEEFEVAPDVLRTDVSAFLSELESAALVRRS
ncbi:MAG TPA: PqqD family protein [Labilithrix sp.]|jgi:hypothetical protein|nr:PqqD family protein [Labilithrix sp.]